LREEDMPYNEELDTRIKKMVSRWEYTTNKKMFGGVCHLISGNMFCGVHKDSLILRLGEEFSREAMSAKYVRQFDITGKPMKGWVMVAEEGYKKDKDLKDWLEKAKKFAKTLPAK
jgi:TfoX/Sxy family transcriptional regulator of competence genes